jgi:predicted permease
VFWRRKRRAADFNEEIRAHLQLEADELKSDGLAEVKARAAARKAFGNVTAAEERFYEKGRLLWLENVVQDLSYGLRNMRLNARFTLAVVVTLALAVGANTAIFSLINTVLLRSLPVKDPASLYFLSNVGMKGRVVGGLLDDNANSAPPYPCFERFRLLAKSFAGMAAYADNDFGIRIVGPIEQVDGARVSANYYDVLGVTPFAGRLFNAGDDRLDPPVAVISYQYWQRRFGGSPEAIGKSFSLDGTLDGRRFVIVGITPEDFHGLAPGHHDDVTMPMAISGPVLRSTSSWFFKCVARLKPGVAPEQARAEVDTIFQAFMNEFPPSADARRDYYNHIEMSPASHGLDTLRRRFSRPLWALMAVVGLVLLIGCANITNLLLARAAKRQREFAVRMAIGAGRSRLFRQVLVETGLLFAAGAVAGTAVAWWAARGLIAFFAGGARPILLEIHWDWRVLGFTAGLSLLATVVFGAAPALGAMRADPHTAIKDGGRTASSRGQIGFGRFLVAFQVALSLILLVGAALFLRTLHNLYTNTAMFHADEVALIAIHLPDASYHEADARVALWDRLLRAVREIPGVRSAGISRLTPLDGYSRGVGFETAGFQPRSDQERTIGLNTASEDYFDTLGTPIVEGRDFTANDRAGAPNVALLNQSAVRQFFRGRDPIGEVVKLQGHAEYRIVGVVQDARHADLRKEAEPFAIVPLRQPIDSGARLTLSIRTPGNPRAVIAAAVAMTRTLGPDIHILRTGTLARQLDESLIEERLIFTLAMAFGVLALLLSAVGLYGVLAYSVERRTPEIGIRMTLGALPGQVAWGILGETAAVVVTGLAAGIPISMWLARFAGELLYGVTPGDAVAQVGAAAVLATVALVASYLPARRAGRIDPASALRNE